MMEFFAMGGYGPYVWSAFGLSALVLVANVVSARIKYRQTVTSIQGQIRREQRLQNKWVQINP